MMNGTLLDGLPSASSTMPNGSFSSSTKRLLVGRLQLAGGGEHELARAGPSCPSGCSEATQSSAVTGWPSWKRRPSRSVKLYFMRVAADRVLVDHLRLDLEVGVGGEQRVPDHVAVVARDVGGRPDRVEDLEIPDRDEAQRAAPLRRLGRARAWPARRRRARRCRPGTRDESRSVMALLLRAESVSARDRPRAAETTAATARRRSASASATRGPRPTGARPRAGRRPAAAASSTPTTWPPSTTVRPSTMTRLTSSPVPHCTRALIGSR